MTKQQLLIPAGGTVRFIVWNYADDADMPTLFDIEGDTEWSRPVVGLVFGSWWGGSTNPLKPSEDGQEEWRYHRSKTLTTHPLVVDEAGEVIGVHDYLHSILGDDHWDHSTHIYRPHISGPVGDAPRIHRLAATDGGLG